MNDTTIPKIWFSRQFPAGSVYTSKLCGLYEMIKNTVWNVPPEFYYYTLHNILHIDSCLNIFDILLKTCESIGELSEEKKFLLNASIIMHDIGMYLAIRDDESKEAIKLGISNDEYIREKHAERIHIYIAKNSAILNHFLSFTDQNIVSEICVAHGLSTLDDCNPLQQELGALLCLIDILDFGSERVPYEFIDEHLDKMPVESKWQWIKHYVLTSIKNGNVEKSDDCENASGQLYSISTDLNIPKEIYDNKQYYNILLSKLLDDINSSLERYCVNKILKRYFKVYFKIKPNEVHNMFRPPVIGGIKPSDIISIHFGFYEEQSIPSFDKFLEIMFFNHKTKDILKIANNDYALFLENIYKNELASKHEELAKHFKQGNNYVKAAKYSLLSAKKRNKFIPFDILTDKLFLYQNEPTDNTSSAKCIKRAFELMGKCSIKDHTGKTWPQTWSSILRFEIVMSYGLLFRFKGDWEKAKKIFKICENIINEIEGESNEKEQMKAEYQFELGSLIFEMGEIDNGLNDVKGALELRKDKGIDLDLVKVLKALGNMYREDGRFDESKDYLELALNIMRFILNQSNNEIKKDQKRIYDLMVCDCWREVGNVYACYEEFDKANKCYDEVLDIINKQNETDSIVFEYIYGITLYHQAKIDLHRGKIAKAIEKLEKGEEILDKYENIIRRSFIYDALGKAYSERGDKRSEAKFKTAETIRFESKHKHFEALTNLNLSKHYLKIKEYKEAETRAQAAANIWIDLNTNEKRLKFDIVDAYMSLGEIYAKWHDSERQENNTKIGTAIENYEKALKYQNILKNNEQPNLFNSSQNAKDEKSRAIQFAIEKLKNNNNTDEKTMQDDDFLTIHGEYKFHEWIEKLEFESNKFINIECGIGDDAAVISLKQIIPNLDNCRFVLTTDAAPGSICQKEEDKDGEYAAKFSVVHSISDLLAMGATPVAVLLNLYLKRDSKVSYAEKVLKKVKMESERYGATLIGGDIKERESKSIGCVGIGILPGGQKPLERRNAHEGQIVAISLAHDEENKSIRKIGKRWAADILNKINDTIGLDDNKLKELAQKYNKGNIKEELLFLPYKEMIAAAKTNKIGAAIDTSDGFMACLEIIARESECGLEEQKKYKYGFVLEEDLINDVIDEEVMEIASILNIHPAQFLFNAGHDWEIVMTINKDDFLAVQEVIKKQGGGLAPLGRVVKYTNEFADKEIGIITSKDTKNSEQSTIRAYPVYRIPVFTDEKFVRNAYQKRIFEWEELAINERLKSNNSISFDYQKIPSEFRI